MGPSASDGVYRKFAAGNKEWTQVQLNVDVSAIISFLEELTGYSFSNEIECAIRVHGGGVGPSTPSSQTGLDMGGRADQKR